MLLAACGHASRDVEIILPETRFEIATNAPAIIERGLAAGAYSVVLAEDEIDTRTSLMLADRAIVLEDPVERHGRQIAHFVLPADATVRIEVESTDHRTKSGGSVVEIARWTRAINADPTDAEQGDSAYSDAIVAYAKDKEQSFKDADAALEAAAYRYRKANDSRAEATTLYARGRLAYLVAGDWLAAERSARAAKDIAADLDDRIAVARADMLIAAARIERAGELAGEARRDERTELLSTADRLLESSATTFAKIASPIDLAAALTFQGVGRWAAREAGPARAAFEKAVQVANEANDAFSEARALGNLAWLDYERADIHAAAAEYERLLQLVERDRQPDLYASLVSNYGVCLILLGDFDQALSLHNDALKAFSDSGNNALRARELMAIGKLHLNIGNSTRALETLETSLTLLQQANDPVGTRSALGLAGTAAALAGDDRKALGYHRDLLAMSIDARMVARARVLIAGDLRALNQLDEAEAELALAIESATDSTLASALVARGLVKHARNDSVAATRDFKKADDIYSSLGLDYPRIETQTALSRVYLITGEWQAALEAADRAIQLVGRIRFRSVSSELQARFVSGQYAPYEARIAALLRMSNGEAGVRTALATAESVRARMLTSLVARPAIARSATDFEVDELRDQLTAQQLRLEARLQAFDSSDSQALRLQRDVVETKALLDAAFQSSTSRDVFDGTPALDVSPDAAVGERLPPDTSILYFFVGETSSIAWIISKQEIKYVELPERRALESAVQTFVSSIGPAGTDEQHAGMPKPDREVINKLASLAFQISDSRLTIIPDGPLHSMPFVALDLPGMDGQRALWLDRFQIGYSPSLQLAQHRRTSEGQTNRNLVAVIADPVYALDDSRMRVAGGRESNHGRALRSEISQRFVRLPFSAVEADEVVSAMSAEHAIRLEGFDASVSRVEKLPYDQLAVLHFATHSIARSDSPGLSALYLSAVKEDGSAETKDHLSADDIVRLGVRADLVVLSACATGDGSRLSGEGVLGLTHSFLANGSKAVVASLWPIEDAATARLMGQFYRAYAKSHDPVSALQYAQQQLRKSAGSVGALDWSSFIVRTNSLK